MIQSAPVLVMVAAAAVVPVPVVYGLPGPAVGRPPAQLLVCEAVRGLRVQDHIYFNHGALGP